MEPRLNAARLVPEGYRNLLALSKYLHGVGFEPTLLHIVYLRVSQINGCAYCTDMHWKDARHTGASEQQLSLLTAWRESPGFTNRERAALAYAEAVTLISEEHISDELYEETRAHFSEVEISNLTLAIGTINVWNRIAISFRYKAGDYQPA